MRILLALILAAAQVSQGQGLFRSHNKTTGTPATTDWNLTNGNGGLQNNFDGCVGGYFTVGGTPITITALARWTVNTNSATHVLYLTAADGTILGSVSVNTSGATPTAWLFGTLGSPVALSASTKYYIVSQEANGGDLWYNDVGAYSVTAAAVSSGSTYLSGTCSSSPMSGFNDNANTGVMFGGFSFKYY